MQVGLITKTNKKGRSRDHRNQPAFINQIREESFNLRYRLTDTKDSYEALTDPNTSYYFSTPSVREHLRRYRKAIRKEEPNQTAKKSLKRLITGRINEKFTDHLSPNTVAYEDELTDLELETLNKRSTENIHKRSKKSLHSNSSLTHRGFSMKRKHGSHAKPHDNTLSHQLAPSPSPSPSPQSQTEYPKISTKQSKETPSVKQSKPSVKTPRLNVHFQKTQRETGTKHEQPEAEVLDNGSVKQQTRMKTTSKDLINQKLKADRLAEQLHQKKHQKWLKFLQQKKEQLTKMRAIDNNPETNETRS